MYKQAIKFFTDLSKSDDYLWSLNNISSIDNVWSWLPDDTTQFSVVRCPQSPAPQAEAIWIIHENYGGENLSDHPPTVWFCGDSQDLDKAIQTIKDTHRFI
jgi:hypothetical protein